MLIVLEIDAGPGADPIELIAAPSTGTSLAPNIATPAPWYVVHAASVEPKLNRLGRNREAIMMVDEIYADCTLLFRCSGMLPPVKETR